MLGLPGIVRNLGSMLDKSRLVQLRLGSQGRTNLDTRWLKIGIKIKVMKYSPRVALDGTSLGGKGLLA